MARLEEYAHRRDSMDLINYDESDNDDFDERIWLQTSYTSHMTQTHNSRASHLNYGWNRIRSQKKSEGISAREKILLTTLVIFGIVAIYMNSDYLNTKEIPTNISRESIFYNDVYSLGLKYNLNKDAVLQIWTGLSSIFKNERTMSLIFVYNSNADTFEPTVFNNFIKDLADKTVKFLRSDGSSAYVVVDTRTMQTYRTGVMLYPDVHEVPSELAMTFHFYYVEQNHLVKRSATFFTLDVATCFNDIQIKHEFIRKCYEDKIGPILNRSVNIFIDTFRSGN